MSKAGKVATWLVKKLWMLLAVFLVLFAVMLSVMRYALPHIDHKKYLLEDYVSEKYGVELKIGSVQADWEKSGPSIVLNDVVLANGDSSPVALGIKQVHMEIDFWESLRLRMLSSNAFTLDALTLEIDADRLDGAGESDFPVVDALKSLFLEQLQRFSLTDGEVAITRNNEREVLQLESLSWINKDRRHQGTGAVRVQELANNSASFILDLTGTPDSLDGVMYARAEDLDISPWVSGLLATRRPLRESRANFEVWAEVKESHFSAFYTEFHESKLAWGGDDALVFNSGIRGGSIQAQPVKDKWHFRVDQLIFDANDQSLVTDLVGTVSDNELLVNTVKPAPVNPFLVLLPLFTDDTADDNIRDINPGGQLATLQVKLQPKGFDLAAKLIDVSWDQDGYVPGLSHLDMDIFWHKKQGVVLLSADDSTLDIDNLLPESVKVSKLRGKVFVYRQSLDDGNHWVVQSHKLDVQSDKLSFQPAFRFDTTSRELSVSADIASRPVKDIQHLLPGPVIGKNTTAFLNRAFVGPGQIEGATILWQGKPAEFPFSGNEGVFQAKVQLTGSTFRFSDDWLPLEGLDLTLLFENDSLTMHSPGGTLGGVAVSDMTAVIPALRGDSKVIIDATGNARGADVTSLMLQSSLSGSLGRLLEKDVQIKGDLSAGLHLEIPFDSNKVIAQGEVTLPGNDVHVSSVKMNFTGATGKVSFENEKVQFTDLEASLLGQPVRLSFDGKQEDEDYLVDLSLDGTWNINPLLAEFNPDFDTYLSGDAHWQAVVALRIPPEGFSYRANITTPLTGLSSKLPAPFAKTADSDLLFNVISEGNEQASTVKASLGDDVRFEGVLPHQEMQFSRAHLALGDSDFVGMGIGFSISAAMDVVNVTDWYKTIELLVSGMGSGGESGTQKNALFSVPERIFVNAGNLVIAGQNLHNAKITTKQQNNNWMLDINATEARATVNLYDDWLSRGVAVEADYIRFESWESEDEGVAHNWDANTLPPVYFHCKQCIFLDKDLGEVTLDVAKATSGLDIRQLSAVSKHGKFSAKGKWVFDGDDNNTLLGGSLESDDVGLMLKNWGVDSGIKDSGARMNFDLSWAKSPMDFSAESLTGDVEWSLSDGYLSEVSDKGSRIFTLFSLNSLVRKLSLDFRDVFAKGFFYDDMSGTLSIADGKAYTGDTVIDGGAGEINIKGYTDLVENQLNYNVVFSPNVTGNLPILVYFLATPPTALAALALDQVLTSAKVISNVNYHVTGSLSEPVFEEVGRDSKEVALPAKTRPATSPDDPITDQDMERIKLEVNNG